MDKCMFTSEKDYWSTPIDFFNKLDEEFNFDLDPCCFEQTAKCKKFFTKKENGLIQDWQGHSVFCNPPYGKDIGQWVKKCFKESKKPDTLVVMLIPARTDTSYFHKYIYKQAKEIRFIKGRLKFEDFSNPDKKLAPAPFPSMVVVFKNTRSKMLIKKLRR